MSMFIDQTPGRNCFINGREYLFFSGYAYLGMNHVEEFISCIKEGIGKYGILFPSSRISNTRLSIFDKMEEALSEMLSVEDSVLFSSGYLAGQTIASALSRHMNIFIAPGTHPSICIPGIPVPAQSFKEWSARIIEILINNKEKQCVLIADSVNILESSVNDFSFVSELPKELQITFLIDDSHSIGILGDHGEGVASRLIKQANVDYIISYSLSKAFNFTGGAVSASSKWCNMLRENANYSGSTPISPAFIHAFLQSRGLYNNQRQRLNENIVEFIKAINLSSEDQNLPVFICNNHNAANVLFDKGIVISSFAYPLPNSKLVNRVILNALHTNEDIHKIAEAWRCL